MNVSVKKNIPNIITLCEKYTVERMFVFGSALNEDFSPTSDVDFLITFKENLSVEQYTNSFFEIREALKNLLKRDIDIITQRSLSNPFLI
jgi:hypothetical protein